VFLDESGAQTSMTRTRGRAPKGQRVVAQVPAGHWTVVTVIGAVRTTGPFAAATVVGATDSDVFRTYVREVLAPQLHPGDVVVMDNLSPHRASGVREGDRGGRGRAALPAAVLPRLQPDRTHVEQGEGEAAIPRRPQRRHAARCDRGGAVDGHPSRLRRILPTLRIRRYLIWRAALAEEVREAEHE